MASVDRLGLPLARVTDTLVTDGIRLFADAADKLLGAVARKRADFLGDRLDRQTVSLGADLQKALDASLDTWRRDGAVRRLWQRDATLIRFERVIASWQVSTLANLGMTTQLATFGLCMALGHPVAFVWVVVCEAVGVAALLSVQPKQEVSLEHR